MRWKNKLTPNELEHLRTDAKCTTLKQVKNMAEDQKKIRDTHPRTLEPCHECKNIMIKLGVEI